MFPLQIRKKGQFLSQNGVFQMVNRCGYSCKLNTPEVVLEVANALKAISDMITLISFAKDLGTLISRFNEKYFESERFYSNF